MHVPFCGSKCGYCSFYSVTPNGKLIQDYVDAICVELAFYKGLSHVVDSIYFGGGTPNILSFKHLAKIVEAIKNTFKVANNVEITVEMNPEFVSEENVKELVLLGVNRASVGVQSFKDEDLVFLGRKHSAKKAIEAIKILKTCGIKNISIDLILGLMNYSNEDLVKFFELAEILDVSHISGYLLKIEKGTIFGKRALIELPDEDEVSSQYHNFAKLARQYGYEQYEISNFTRSEKKSIHNLKYWHCEEYVGVGPTAHSYLMERRYYVSRDVYSYVSQLKNADQRLKTQKGMLPPHLRPEVSGLTEVDEKQLYFLEPCDKFSERVMMGLRLTEGVLLNELRMIDEERYETFCEKLSGYQKFRGFIKNADGRVCLTQKGFLVSNYIIANLLY